MKRVLIALAVALTATSAHAQCGSSATADVLRLTEWKAELLDGEGVYSLSISYENATDRGVRMIEGIAYFMDALNRPIGTFEINPDLRLEPGETASQDWPRIVEISGEPRLAMADPSDVTGRICVKAVVYEDGSVERFDG